MHREAEDMARAAEEVRARAFEAFERDDWGPAEVLWKDALAREEDTDRRRREVVETTGRALELDPHDAAARALAADATFERLLAAERLYKKSLVGALGADLDVYDDGSRRARLREAGHMTATTDPPGAKLLLARYREDDARRLVETDAASVAPDERRVLEPGSYVLTAEADGRAPVRYPFLLRRGEESVLRIVLPRAEDVPPGMIYVPAGRTLYGSGDDEGTRGFFMHQPRHDVEVGAFLISRTEVTNGEYIAFLEALPSAERNAKMPQQLTPLSGGGFAWELDGRVLGPGEPYCSGAEPCADWSRLPVLGTDRVDAEAFVEWLARSGRLARARLCTDREWERAARGADDRQFPAGNADPAPTEACTAATYGGDVRHGVPCVVGTHPGSRSPFGVDDLTGNAWEWTSGAANVAHPTQGITRGAAWDSFSLFLAISNRGVQLITARARPFGLRVCADVR
jgi:formylglycine-generating enzyme required for sulfatase activity